MRCPQKPTERGQILVMAALALVVLLGFLGLAVDLGRLYVERQRLRNWCDAAAAAGARDLPGDAAAALQNAFRYFCAPENAGGTPPANPVSGTAYAIPGTQYVVTATTPYNGDATAIRVSATRQVESLFLRLLGVFTTPVSAYAVAINDQQMSGIPLVAYSQNPLPGGRNYSLSINGNNNRFLTSSNTAAGYAGQQFSLIGNNNGPSSGAPDVIEYFGSGSNQIVGKNNVVGVPAQRARNPGDEPWEDPVTLRRFFRRYVEGYGEAPHIPPVASEGSRTISNSSTYNGPRYIVGNLTVNGRATLRGWWYVTGNITVSANSAVLDSTADSDPRSGFYAGGNITVSGNGVRLKGVFHAGGTISLTSNQLVLQEVILYSDTSALPYGVTITGQQTTGTGSIAARSGINVTTNGFDMTESAPGAPGRVVLFAGVYDADNDGGRGRHVLRATGNNTYFSVGMTLYNPYGHVEVISNNSTCSIHADTIAITGNGNVFTPAGGGGNPVSRISE
ncbi:MAG: pilus assembly protein TadG-related protein [Armatimonadota bacterium]|nr:pilus assembly protein TadG-related protein [Armatimonadota bacterium]